MTPLAQRIVKNLTLPTKDRNLIDPDSIGLLQNMGDVHCFEVTEVRPLIEDLAERMGETALREDSFGSYAAHAFLPAPKTWIEYEKAGLRHGYLFEQTGQCARISFAQPHEHGIVCGPYGFMPLSGAIKGTAEDFTWITDSRPDWMEPQNFAHSLKEFFATLAIINSPKVIGRRQHMPHRGLERDLLRQQPTIGRYPLHAWSEITLHAHPTYVDESGEEHEAHLTGRKCLHFCRAHLRIKLGRLELVSAHWRGDPALGIKRTRYKVEA